MIRSASLRAVTRTTLVVDDHDAVRQAICDRLGYAFAQFRVRQAATVADALRIVEAESVDIVLMDIRLPDADGIAGTRMVLERSPDTLVVVVSILDDVSHREAAFAAGAYAFVSKWSIGRELVPTLRRLTADAG